MNIYALAAVLALVALVAFVILREFWTWYWKQSAQVILLKRIADSLERLEASGVTPTSPSRPAAAVVSARSRKDDVTIPPFPTAPAPSGVLGRLAAYIG